MSTISRFCIISRLKGTSNFQASWTLHFYLLFVTCLCYSLLVTAYLCHLLVAYPLLLIFFYLLKTQAKHLVEHWTNSSPPNYQAGRPSFGSILLHSHPNKPHILKQSELPFSPQDILNWGNVMYSQLGLLPYTAYHIDNILDSAWNVQGS